MTLHRWADIKDKKLRMPMPLPTKRRRWPDNWYLRGGDLNQGGPPITPGQRRRFWKAVRFLTRHRRRSRR